MPEKKSALDWGLFAALTLLWAGAYACTRYAVNQDDPAAGLPTNLIVPTRMTIGAAVLLIVATVSSQRWPPVSHWRSWAAMAGMGLVGTAFPFYLITTAQKTVDSSLAALYVAAAPLFVAVMAHLVFHDDRISPAKVFGLIVGFSGVALLFGGDALIAFNSASVTAQAFLLLATAFYASSTIIARFARDIPPFIFSAGFVTMGAITTWPLLLDVDYGSLAPARSSILGVIGLGVGPTATASLLYVILVQRTSATFLSLTGYTIPVVSAILGYILFTEVQSWTAIIAFIMILSGVWFAQRGNTVPVKAETSPQSP
ncbi:MAG: DMT family transporter [Henriciella sp.]|nr:DMT family transporter [Henriciella sp.]